MIYRELVLSRERMMDEHDNAMTLAWTIVVLDRQKKVPELKTLFAKRTQQQGRQSVGEMRSMLYALSAKYGLEVRKGGKTLVAAVPVPPPMRKRRR